MAAVILLPVAERELRVAARRPSTFWLRVSAGLIAFLIGATFTVLAAVGQGGATASALGRGLFGTLSWLTLVTVLPAGLFFTSDCLSEEKREGTLGFLFLTDLRGYDIVLGKLLATSLRGAFALLAVFPVLALTLPLGGVAGAELWKTSLALVNALLMSLAAGLFVSALCRDSQRAMSGTLLLLLLLAGGGPATDALIAAAQESTFTPRLSLASPVYVFVAAGGWGSTAFWPGLLLNSGITAALFAAASFALPRWWQERETRPAKVAASRVRRWRFGNAARPTAWRERLLEANPVVWLAFRRRRQAAMVWSLALLQVAPCLGVFLSERPEWWMLWNYVAGFITLLVYLRVAAHAGSFHTEARRSGLLELLLATPLSTRQILLGQWRGMLRVFGVPLALFMTALFLGQVLGQMANWKIVAKAFATTPTVAVMTTNTPAVPNLVGTNSARTAVGGAAGTATIATATTVTKPPGLWAACLVGSVSSLNTVTNLAAVCWFGLWMGLISRSGNAATLKTIVFVLVIPWFVTSIVGGILVPLVLVPSFLPGAAFPQMIMWFPVLSAGLYALISGAKNAFFIRWSWRRLNTQFRDRVASVKPAPRQFTPPPLPPALPPVVGQPLAGR